jgi:FtsZ-binding cell division protein ZapB
MGMKRTALAIVLITVIVLSIATWFVHSKISELQNQISELQAQNSELYDQNRDLQDKNNELQEQLNELQKQIDDAAKVMITEFSSLRGWWNPVGATMAVDLDITILNTGINDVEGLTLEIKRLNFDEDPFNRTITLGIFHAGETIEIQESIIVSMDRYFDEFYNSVFAATLKLGEVVLHVRTLQITNRQV